MSKRTKATVHDLTAERARRGRVPWEFTVDLARDHFKLTIFQGAGPHDLLAMAEACEKIGRNLIRAGRQLRKGADVSGPKTGSGAK